MEQIKKFDRYCYEMQKEAKYETIHSSNMAVMRKKLRKMLISMFNLDEDISKCIESFWKIAYYAPTNRFLKRSEDLMETTTLLTIFCGELQELSAFSEDKPAYSSLFNLYLGDLHRYMSETDLQRLLSSNYYAKCLEIDQKHGRAFSILATLQPAEGSKIEKLRLFFRSLFAEKSYNCESSIREIVESMQLGEDTDFHQFLGDFVHWCLFESSSRSDHNNNGVKFIEGFDQYLKNENFESALPIFSMAGVHAVKAIGNDRYIHCFEVCCDIFTKVLSCQDPGIVSEVAVLTICEWVSMTCEILAQTIDLSTTDEQSLKKKKFLETFPVFTKSKWEKFCDLLCSELNKHEKEIRECLENEQFLEEDVYYKINGIENRNTMRLLTFWSQQICVVSLAHFETCEDSTPGSPLFKRIVHSRHRKLDMPHSESSSPSDTSSAEGNSSWKPIYIMVDYTPIVEDLGYVLKLWKTDDFINIISSKTLAKLDQMKTKNPSIRRAIREIHLRQTLGKVRIINGNSDEACCKQLIDSAKENGLKEHEEVVAILVGDVDNYHSFEMKGVSIQNIEQFFNRCTKSEITVR